MSGIAGIVNVDAGPVDGPLLHGMAQLMRYRGPDDHRVWADGAAGLAHTMLRTGPDSRREAQPCSLDGDVWITADVRLDGRDDLLRRLRGKTTCEAGSATDPELILHAYSVWDENCIDHLLGDFVFAVWDRRRRRLFCARDHFGVKPFYYANAARTLLFSNTLNALRLHPEVSAALNESAIGDFLLFDFNRDPATTTFRDIHRLPAAHLLTWSPGQGLQMRRYWHLPVDGEIARYKNPSDYVERFRELLHDAVGDRVRTDSVAISQSGGLDSTTLAAAVTRIRAERGAPREVRSYCLVYDRRFPDDERYYSTLAANSLGIPIEHLPADDYQLFERMDEQAFARPEPVHDPLLARSMDLLMKSKAGGSRIMLLGEDPDALLFPATVVEMFKGMPLTDVIGDLVRYAVKFRRRPPLGLGIYATVTDRFIKRRQESPYPTWLNPDFEARLSLRQRWEDRKLQKSLMVHPIRGAAYRRLTQPLWSWLLEYWDPGTTSLPVEVRHPYLDVRLVNYVLSIPPLPWCFDKELLRASTQGVVPDAVRLRPKTPLRGYPFYNQSQIAALPGVAHLKPTGLEAAFIRKQQNRPGPEGHQNPCESWVNLRPLSLTCWLHSQATSKVRSLQAELT